MRQLARRPPVSRLAGSSHGKGGPAAGDTYAKTESVYVLNSPPHALTFHIHNPITLLVLYRYTSPSPSVLCLSFHLVLSRDPRRTLSKSRVRKYRTPPGREVKIMRSST